MPVHYQVRAHKKKGGSRIGKWLRRTGSFLRHPFRRSSRTTTVVASPTHTHSSLPLFAPLKESTIMRTGNKGPSLSRRSTTGKSVRVSLKKRTKSRSPTGSLKRRKSRSPTGSFSSIKRW